MAWQAELGWVPGGPRHYRLADVAASIGQIRRGSDSKNVAGWYSRKRGRTRESNSVIFPVPRYEVTDSLFDGNDRPVTNAFHEIGDIRLRVWNITIL